MGEDAGVYEELKQLKFNVEVLRKTGEWFSSETVDILEENNRHD
jgi:hypothetical protein